MPTNDSHRSGAKWVTRRELAKHLNITKRRVAQLVKARLITEVDRPDKRGINLARAIAQYNANTDVGKREASRLARGHLKVVDAPAEAAAPPATEPPPVATPAAEQPADLFNFNDAKARKETYNAERARIEAERLAGKLVSREEVQTREFEIARKLRDRLLGFPAKVANIVPPEAMKTITDEIDRLVREMQDDAAQF